VGFFEFLMIICLNKIIFRDRKHREVGLDIPIDGTTYKLQASEEVFSRGSQPVEIVVVADDRRSLCIADHMDPEEIRV